MSANRVLPIAYDEDSVQSNSIVSGERFSCKKKFTIFSSKPIPKHMKSYMEFTITYHPSNAKIRHLPLYVGIHKEPSVGVIASDMCLGSIYYCNPYYYDDPKDWFHPTSFQSVERYNYNAEVTITKNTAKLGSRVPYVGHTIGIGVDMVANTISIFVEGAKMYSFSPTTFNMNNDPEDFYFCITSQLDNETINGNINFGRYKCHYTPEGYWSLYQYYYYKSASMWDINTTIQAGTVYTNPPIAREFNVVDLKVQNDLAPINFPTELHRYSKLIYSDPVLKYANNDLAMVLRSPDSNDIATLCYPIPVDQKIYLEFVAKNAFMKLDSDGHMLYNGIPVKIGLTSAINEIANQKVFWIDMAHKKHVAYKKHSNMYNVHLEYDAGTIMNPSIPIQPNEFGLIIDLAHNKLSVYTNGDLFMEVDMVNNDFSLEKGLYWLFIQPLTDAFQIDPLATDDPHIIVNDGQNGVIYDNLVDNNDVMTYWYYYNYLLRFKIFYDIDVFIETLPYKTNYSKYIRMEVIVPDKEEDKWSPGMNKLWKTYNVVTDQKPHNNDSTITAFDMWANIKKDANSWNKRT